jgi:hypothetical protein
MNKGLNAIHIRNSTIRHIQGMNPGRFAGTDLPICIIIHSQFNQRTPEGIVGEDNNFSLRFWLFVALREENKAKARKQKYP